MREQGVSLLFARGTDSLCAFQTVDLESEYTKRKSLHLESRGGLGPGPGSVKLMEAFYMLIH